MIYFYHLSWFQWGIFTSMGWSRDFFWWQKYRSQQVGVWKSTRIARMYLMTKFIHFPMIFPWFSPFKRGKSRGRSLFWKKTHVLKRAARCTTFRCSGFWWFAHGSQFRDQVVSHDPKRVYRMYRGFLKMGDPQVTMGFNTENGLSWMTWGVPPRLGKPVALGVPCIQKKPRSPDVWGG